MLFLMLRAFRHWDFPKGLLEQGEAAWTLVAGGDRRLTQVMPIEGKVIAVNEKLRENPELLQESPYKSGWLLCVRPRRLQDTLTNLLHGKSADAWRTSTREDVVSRLAPAMGTVAHDGGEWVRAAATAYAEKQATRSESAA